MALSGNFHHYVSGEFGLVCDWTGVQNTGGNYTDITLNVYLRYYNLDVGARTDNTVNINGTSSTFSTDSIYRMGASSYTNKLLTTKTVRVKHNADGTKTNVTLSASYHFNGTYAGSSVQWITASTTVNLDPIGVYSLSVSAGANTSITVNRTSSGYGSTGNLVNGARLYSGDKLKITFTANAGYSVSGTVNGTPFTSGGTHTVAGNVSVVSSAAVLASTVSATSANIGGISTVTVTKGKDSYYHSLQYSFGSGGSAVTGYITSSGGTSATEKKFTATSISFTVPTTFYAAIPSAKSGTCTITCRTYSSSSSTTVVGTSTCTFTATAAQSDCAPTVSGAVVDTNSTTTALTGDSSKLIRYKSTAKCTISAAAQNSATLSSKTVNGYTCSNTKSFYNVDTGKFVFKAVDSRGYSTSSTVNATLIQYVELTCNPVVKRDSPSSNTIKLTSCSGTMFVGNYQSGVSNIITLEYRYKLSTDASFSGSYTSITTQTSNQSRLTYGVNSYTLNEPFTLGTSFDYTKSYDFEIRVRDGARVSGQSKYLSTVSKTVNVPMGVPVFDWGKDDFCINVNAKGKLLGLGEAKSRIVSGEDMDNYQEPGVYRVFTSSDAETIANCPAATAGTLRVWTGRGVTEYTAAPGYYRYLIQEFVSVTGKVWRRYAANTQAAEYTWREWKKDMDSDDVADVVGDKRRIDTHVGDTSPYWKTAVLNSSYVVASCMKRYEIGTDFTLDDITINGSAVGCRSTTIYLPLPYPLWSNAMTLCGVTDSYGGYISNLSNVNNIGVSFRLYFPYQASSFTADHIYVRFSLSGMILEPNEAPPANVSNTRVSDAVSAAESYTQAVSDRVKSFAYGRNFTYTSWDADDTINNGSGAGMVECDTYTTLIMRCIKFYDSPFRVVNSSNSVPPPTDPFYFSTLEHPETTEDLRTDSSHSNKSLALNPNNKTWVSRINDVAITEGMKFFGRPLRYAADWAWIMWHKQCIFSDAAQVRTGDLAFWVDPNNSRNVHYFGDVTHVAFVKVENGEPYVFEVSTSTTVNGTTYPVLRKMALSLKAKQPAYFARVEYAS